MGGEVFYTKKTGPANMNAEFEKIQQIAAKLSTLSNGPEPFKFSRKQLVNLANDLGCTEKQAEDCVKRVQKLGDAYANGTLGDYISKKLLFGVNLATKNFNMIANNSTFYDIGVLMILAESVGSGSTSSPLKKAFTQFVSAFDNLDFAKKPDLLSQIGEAFGVGLTAVLDVLWGLVSSFGVGIWDSIKALGKTASAIYDFVNGDYAECTKWFRSSFTPGTGFDRITGFTD